MISQYPVSKCTLDEKSAPHVMLTLGHGWLSQFNDHKVRNPILCTRVRWFLYSVLQRYWRVLNLKLLPHPLVGGVSNMFQMILYGTMTRKSRGLQFMEICEMRYWVASLAYRIYYVGHLQFWGPSVRLL
jgi:hypothetical protein